MLPAEVTSDLEELDRALGTLARCLYRLALMTGPFMPNTAARLGDALGQDQAATAAWEPGVAPPVGGSRTRRVEALFPKDKQE